MSTCLYCTTEANSLEHPLPAAFGEFTNAPMLDRRVCAGCNTRRLSLLDQQIARCGPEGLMRKFYGVQGRPENAKVNPFVRGSAGGRRLEFSTFDREVGVEVNLEIENGVVRQMCELIFVETESGRTCHLPLTEGMTAEQARASMKRLGITEPFETRLSCYPDERDWVEALVRAVSPEVTFSEPKLMSYVIEQPQATFVLGERYFRAFAKIGFHYFLTQFPMYTGREEMFAKIRAFIYEDTTEPVRRINEFIGMRQHPLLLPMLNPDARPNGWRGHVLAAETRPGVCMAHIQMFLTEENPGLIYTVNLAQDSGITGHEAFAHLYRYYPDGKRGKFSGETESLPAMRVGMTFPPAAPAVAAR
jgi:hypothetical protein